MTEHWFVPGMHYPLWTVCGDTARNMEADTDMGDLSVAEFREFFPHAKRVSAELAGQLLVKLPKLRGAFEVTEEES